VTSIEHIESEFITVSRWYDSYDRIFSTDYDRSVILPLNVSGGTGLTGNTWAVACLAFKHTDFHWPLPKIARVDVLQIRHTPLTTQNQLCTPTIDYSKSLAEQYLLYAWKFIPAVTESGEIQVPSEDVQKKFCKALFDSFCISMLENSLKHGQRQYGHPWECHYNTDGGNYWSCILFRAAYAVDLEVHKWEKTRKNFGTK
jgi:hypothetical protein